MNSGSNIELYQQPEDDPDFNRLVAYGAKVKHVMRHDKKEVAEDKIFIQEWAEIMINGFSDVKHVHSRINSIISEKSAGKLKSYLAEIKVDRLFVPMAGAEYFAAKMERSGMQVSCFDITPPGITFTSVVESCPLTCC